MLPIVLDGTLRVVGKFIRVISETREPIRLNRRSTMRKLPPSVLAQMKQALNNPDLAGSIFRPLNGSVASVG